MQSQTARTLNKTASKSQGKSKRAQLRRALRGAIAGTAILGSSLLALSGCTRQQYRCKTDTEAYYLLDEKAIQSCEEVNAPYRIEVDARSRMFDPFNPDRPPMPEDDPQSNRFMQLVDGKKGYPLWEANGRTNIVENPQWWSYLPLDERGVLVLDINDAVRLALLHSPEYQNAKEELFLSALDVSSERFLLDSQFFGGFNTSITADGPNRNGAGNSSTLLGIGGSTQRGNSPFQMRKQFATGADLVVGLANSITWQLAGPGNQSANTILDFSLVQPLLRQGGRDVVLERLTLAERTLLANVRAFERFKRAFYVDITTGRGSGGTAPQRRGGVFGAAGFGGFSALGGVFGGGGGGGFAGGGAPGAGGFLGLLQSQLDIDNQKENILQLEDIYLQFEDNYRELQLTMPESLTALPQQQLQVSQQLQQLYSAQTDLLQQQATYESSLDSFKASLGLPPYLCVEVRDPLLAPFKLISQELRDRRIEVQSYRKELGGANSGILALSVEVTDANSGENTREIQSSEELKTLLLSLGQRLAPLEGVLDTIDNEDVPQLEQDIVKLQEAIPVRRNQLNKLMDIADRERDMICALLPFGDFNTSFLEGEGLEELPEELATELDRLLVKLAAHREQFESLRERVQTVIGALDEFDSPAERFRQISESIILGSQDFIAEVTDTVLALQIVQARARTETVYLPEIELTPRDAVEIARINRRDWLNNRAALVNSWRSIEVVADDLESFLDLSISGDVQNFDSNPLSLRGSTGRIRAGLQWDAPITRLQERNNYRQILIQYQRAKRQYYQFEDAIWTTMRSSLRTVRQNQLRFEIQRFAVQNAAVQNSINADIRQINETLGIPSGPNAARDAAQGLTAFLNTQRTLIGTFVNFEALRRSIDLDLGTMRVDTEGLWVDPGPITLETLGATPGEAILEYGLTEGEVLMQQNMQTQENMPIELAPTNATPQSGIPSESSSVRQVSFQQQPASAPPVNTSVEASANAIHPAIRTSGARPTTFAPPAASSPASPFENRASRIGSLPTVNRR